MKLRFLALCLVAVAGIIVAQVPAQAGADKFYITNNASSRIKWLTLTFHLSDGSTAQHRYPVVINQRIIESITVPSEVQSSGHAINVSSACTIDVGIGYVNGNTVWARGYDLCSHTYIEALDNSASAYSSSSYTTPRPDMTPDISDKTTPEPDPDQARTPAQEALFRGDQLLKKNQYTAALSYYNRALKLDPRCIDCLLYRGSTYYYLNQFRPALADFDTGLRIDVKNGWLHLGRGNVEWADGMLDSAVEDFRAASQEEALLVEGTIIGVTAARVNGDSSTARTLLGACGAKCRVRGSLGREMDYVNGVLPGRDLINTAITTEFRTEAHALVGFSALSRGKKGEALPHFKWILQNAKPQDWWRPIVRAQLNKMR